MAGTVDRRGVESVLEGFDLMVKRASNWSLWQQRMLKYQHTEKGDDGRELLEDQLNAMLSTGTNGMYTIRFHKSTDKDGFISDKTAITGSFNFKLQDEETNLSYGVGNTGRVGGLVRVGSADPALIERLNLLESKLAAREAEDELEDEDEGEDSGLGAIGKLFENPMIQQLAGMLLGGGKAGPTVGLAGIPGEDQETRIQSAIVRLKKHDPLLGDNLTKLANMADNDPGKFKFLIGMLPA